MLDGVRRLPYAPGVYRFRDAAGKVLYIGRASQLRARVASYWSDLRDRPRLRRMVPLVAAVEAVVCDSVHEAAWLERNLLGRRKPRWNRARDGQESTVHIGLDDGPHTPGLRILYVPKPGCFGPYLGGARGRNAVSGLHRIRPLAYTGARLTGAERDMATARGVTPGDRDALAASIRAILRREPAELDRARTDLVALREKASANLSFELAAEIHEELAALDWIVSPQRIATLEPQELRAAGWAGGLLVLFRVRAGRLDEWTQRPSTPERAKRYLAETPDAWRDFADRAAELAVSLQQ
ncbi:GIY-YIG nuclease family protein [Dactylosporangium sp. NPDC049140]|jgi:excinuclease ABC subunit C|uniref:GIY-YIG nuclease family protein n=1 Tax=Dactylosporangium sp. NPDC049140 TaxID=3155647 RepID=UPI0033E3BBD4